MKEKTTKPREKKRKRRKKSDLERVKTKLDTVFSKYIRLRDADDKGICKCISCGREYHWKKIQNGHYASRTNYATRWDEMNCNAQCVGCNRFKEGNKIWYRRALVEKYGEDKVYRLEDKSLEKVSFKLGDYQKMLDKYEILVGKLLSKKLEAD